jgi:hypothetical protein
MRRSASFLAFLMFSIIVTVLLAKLPLVEAGGNCQAKLVGNSYDCVFEIESTSPVDFCVEFETGGISSNFDLLIEAADYGCACDNKGSFKSPSFDASGNTFECVGNGFGTEFNGKVSSDKLSGQGLTDVGTSIDFSCTKTTACP